MKKSIYQLGALIAEKIPILKSIMKNFNEKIFSNYFKKERPIKFSGWGMTTQHEHGWNDKFSGNVFRQACVNLKKFDFTPSTKLTKKSVDELKWRHYFVSFSTLYAIKFAQSDNYNFVECGVADGLSAFFALSELSNNLGSNFKMHLYDAWAPMKKESLLDSESASIDKFNDLSIDRTKSNLKEFEQNIIYHKGSVPDTFNQLPKSPESIVYLHIDLNSAKPTLDALNFFFPKLGKNGIIVFDDYGWGGYSDTKNVIDEFFSKQNGILSKLPTGQAVYFHNFNS